MQDYHVFILQADNTAEFCFLDCQLIPRQHFDKQKQ